MDKAMKLPITENEQSSCVRARSRSCWSVRCSIVLGSLVLLSVLLYPTHHRLLRLVPDNEASLFRASVASQNVPVVVPPNEQPSNSLPKVAGTEMQEANQKDILRIQPKPVLDALSNRPLLFLSHILEELAKPPTDRVDWLMWFEPEESAPGSGLSPTIFLPPTNSKAFDEVNLLVSKNSNGIDTSAVFIRVCPWSLEFVSRLLSQHDMNSSIDQNPSDDLPIMEVLASEPRWKRHTVFIPRRAISLYRIQAQDALGGDSGNKHCPDCTISDDPDTAGMIATGEMSKFWSRFRHYRTLLRQLQENLLPKAVETAGFKNAVQAFADVSWYHSDDNVLVEAALNVVDKELAWLKR